MLDRLVVLFEENIDGNKVLCGLGDPSKIPVTDITLLSGIRSTDVGEINRTVSSYHFNTFGDANAVISNKRMTTKSGPRHREHSVNDSVIHYSYCRIPQDHYERLSEIQK